MLYVERKIIAQVSNVRVSEIISTIYADQMSGEILHFSYSDDFYLKLF